jgi:hypothetical protein
MCEFCGHKACEKCCYKQRPFANTKVDTTGMTLEQMHKVCQFGKICKVCDRKFFLRTTYLEYANELVRLEKETE